MSANHHLRENFLSSNKLPFIREESIDNFSVEYSEFSIERLGPSCTLIHNEISKVSKVCILHFNAAFDRFI